VEVPSSFKFAVRMWRWLFCFGYVMVPMLGFAQQGTFAESSGMSVGYYDVLKEAQQLYRQKSGSQTTARGSTAHAASSMPAAAVKIEPLPTARRSTTLAAS